MHQSIIAKKEWRFVFLFSVLIIFITILPFLYGYAITPPDKIFTGVHSVNSFDTYWYVSLIEQAREGNILFKYPSFPEFQKPTIFHPLFLLMGWFAGIFNVPNITAFHLFKVIIGFAFLWTSYIFIANFISDIVKRKLAFMLLGLSSGFGWIFSITENPFLVIDLWSKEINTFLTIYHSPLDMAGITLMLTFFLYFLRLLEQPRAKYAIACGLTILLLLIIHPYEVFTIFLTLLLYLSFLIISKKISIRLLGNKFLIIFLLSLPGVYYNYHSIITSPALNLWFKSAAVLSPPVIYFLFGFGLSAIFSGLAIYKILKQKSQKSYFLLFWIVAAFLLALQPWLHFQLRFATGINSVFAILSAEGVYILYNYAKKANKTVATGLIFWLLILMPLSNLIIFCKDINYFRFKIWPFYLEKNYIDAFSWLKTNTAKNDIILSNRDLAYFIPGFTGNTVFWGLLEYYETDYYEKRRTDVKWFFESNAANEEKMKFLKEKHISYFLYAPDSFKKEGIDASNVFADIYYYDAKNLNPETIKGLKLVYQNYQAKIYKIE